MTTAGFLLLQLTDPGPAESVNRGWTTLWTWITCCFVKMLVFLKVYVSVLKCYEHVHFPNYKWKMSLKVFCNQSSWCQCGCWMLIQNRVWKNTHTQKRTTYLLSLSFLRCDHCEDSCVLHLCNTLKKVKMTHYAIKSVWNWLKWLVFFKWSSAACQSGSVDVLTS